MYVYGKSFSLFLLLCTQVGCGAIGCEILKILALLGVATAPSAQIAIADHDVIEKSNLNRQFLFRAEHISVRRVLFAS